MERCWCPLSQPARQVATNEIGFNVEGMRNPTIREARTSASLASLFSSFEFVDHEKKTEPFYLLPTPKTHPARRELP